MKLITHHWILVQEVDVSEELILKILNLWIKMYKKEQYASEKAKITKLIEQEVECGCVTNFIFNDSQPLTQAVEEKLNELRKGMKLHNDYIHATNPILN
jgi:hypothetical protein